MPEEANVVEEGETVRMELLESLRKGNSTLRLVTVTSIKQTALKTVKWTADSE
jgi:hypothetical protein